MDLATTILIEHLKVTDLIGKPGEPMELRDAQGNVVLTYTWQRKPDVEAS